MYRLANSEYTTSGAIEQVQELFKEMESSALVFALEEGVVFGLGLGLILALRNGGWFVWLQKVAHRRLARAGKLPSPPYDFLEWGSRGRSFVG